MSRNACTAVGFVTALSDRIRPRTNSRGGARQARCALTAAPGGNRWSLKIRAGLTAALICASLTALPSEAAAQHRRAVRAPRRAVVVHRHPAIVYRPYFFYRPYFYDPFFFGYPYYYPYGPFPPYGYYYPRFYTNASYVRIEVEPRDAEVYLDGYFVGMVDDFDGVFQRLTIPPGEHELSIYLEGYRTLHEKRLFRPRTTYHIKNLMEKAPPGQPPAPRPAPGKEGAPAASPQERGEREPEYGRVQPDAASAFGIIAIRTQPADGIVRIDGQVWEHPDSGEPLIVDLAEGSHTIEVEAEGFTPFTKEVDIRRGEKTTLNVSLPRR